MSSVPGTTSNPQRTKTSVAAFDDRSMLFSFDLRPTGLATSNRIRMELTRARGSRWRASQPRNRLKDGANSLNCDRANPLST